MIALLLAALPLFTQEPSAATVPGMSLPLEFSLTVKVSGVMDAPSRAELNVTLMLVVKETSRERFAGAVETTDGGCGARTTSPNLITEA